MQTFNIRTGNGLLTGLNPTSVEQLIRGGQIQARDLIQSESEHIWREVRFSDFANVFPASHAAIAEPPAVQRAAASSHERHSLPRNAETNGIDWEKVTNWVLAFAPLLGLMLRLVVMGIDAAATSETLAGNGDPETDLAYLVVQNAYWWVPVLLNIGLSYLNFYFYRKKTGDTTRAMGRLALVVPVYMFRRAEKLQASRLTLGIWIGLFVMTLVVWLGIHVSAADMVAQATPRLNILGN